MLYLFVQLKHVFPLQAKRTEASATRSTGQAEQRPRQ